MQSLLEGIESKVCLGRPRDPPSDDAVGERVDNERHINKALPRGYVSEVADPEQVRCRRPEHSVHFVARTGC